MPAPRMISTTGSALTADEMSFAWRVFASFSVDMKRGWVKVIRRQDPATGTIVEYHADKDIAYVTPGGAVDYVTMAMPNPVPYRGVSIGVMTVGGATSTYVMASDGTVLASEVLTQSLSTNPPGSPTWPWHYDKYYFNDAFTNASAVWNGGGSVWAMQNDYSSLNGISNYTYQKTNTFDVPEDCIFPAPTVLAPIYTGDDAKTGEWNADWQAGVTAFNTRRKAWFKKNSDEFIAALKTGFAANAPGVTRAELKTGALPASWDYLIKRDVDVAYSTYSADVTVGQKTHREILYTEEGLNDTVDGVPLRPNFKTGGYSTIPFYDTSGILSFTLDITSTAAGVTTTVSSYTYQGVVNPAAVQQHQVEINAITAQGNMDFSAAEAAAPVNPPGDTTIDATHTTSFQQAGARVTKRMVTLRYMIANEPREIKLVGYLTQTVTRHNNAQGAELGLSRKDIYDTWYYDNANPDNVPSAVTAPYLRDDGGLIGAVLNGVVQNGYNADNTLGVPGNPITYAQYVPPFPKASSSVIASLARDTTRTLNNPEFISEWHKDSKILFGADGVGASVVQNDAAMYGVTKVELTPVGLVATSDTRFRKTTAFTGVQSIFYGAADLLAGVYTARLYAFNVDGTRFIDATNKIKTTVSNDKGQIIYSWTTIQYTNAAGVLTDVPGYALNVLFGGKSYWVYPGKDDRTTTVTDMNRGAAERNIATTKPGMFGDGDGTQIEIYGTAVYNFNWQTGSLTFANWKPLHDANGLEVASKTVNLPQGIVWSDSGVNCLVTYRGLHWPDIIKAINTRNSRLSTSTTDADRTLYALISAAKAG